MLGVGWWHTVMRAGRDDGQPLIGDPARTAGVVAVGVDETAFLAASAGFHTQFVTGIVAMSGPGRERAQLLDVVPGRSGSVVQQWISGQDPAWRQQVTTASLDPFRGYATALRTSLPEAVRVLDAFHVVRLGQAAVDDVRRRRQQETLGRRAHREDPLYRGRRLLRRGALALKRRRWTKVALTPTVGDPRGQLTGAWVVAQELQLLYARSHELADTQGRLWRILDRCARSDVPSCCASRAPSTPGPAR
jgi:transposase